MRHTRALERHRDDTLQIVARRRALSSRVFGAALRGDEVQASDLDLLVDTQEDTGLFGLGSTFRRRITRKPVPASKQ